MLKMTGFDTLFAAAGNLYPLLMLVFMGVVMWRGKTWPRKAMYAALVLAVFMAPIATSDYRGMEYRSKLAGGAIVRTWNGDQHPPIASIFGSPDYYAWADTTWQTDGTLLGGVAEADFADSIYGGTGNNKLFGFGDNDALNGREGNDEIDGGAGDDLIGGRLGNDRLFGGDGNDYIVGSSNLRVSARWTPTDTWSPPPPGGRIITQGPVWGIYEQTEADGQLVTIWYGVDKPEGADGDFVDAGAGSDHVMLGAGDDRALGGIGDDDLEGYGGSDVLAGGAGRGDDGMIVSLMHACDLFALTSVGGLLGYPLLHSGTQRMTTETHFQSGRFTQACRRTRRASVPARIRARGRGACGARAALHQHLGLHADSAATANWLRRSGTATRHVCGNGWRGEEEVQAQQVQSMRVTGNKWLERRMDSVKTTGRSTAIDRGAPA